MSYAFELNGAQLVAECDGSLWWPEQGLLAVADLHLEKATSLARRGALLPPYDSRATLQRLALAIQRRAPRLVVSLGDAFHDAAGPGRLTLDDRQTLMTLAAGRDWVWVAGNHEGDAVPFGQSMAAFACGPLVFRHEPATAPTPGEVAGHFHPKAAIRQRGRKIARPCFATDGQRLILPAFGVYTGGLDLLHPDLFRYFGPALRALLCGSDAVHAIPAPLLVEIV